MWKTQCRKPSIRHGLTQPISSKNVAQKVIGQMGHLFVCDTLLFDTQLHMSNNT